MCNCEKIKASRYAERHPGRSIVYRVPAAEGWPAGYEHLSDCPEWGEISRREAEDRLDVSESISSSFQELSDLAFEKTNSGDSLKS